MCTTNYYHRQTRVALQIEIDTLENSILSLKLSPRSLDNIYLKKIELGQ